MADIVITQNTPRAGIDTDHLAEQIKPGYVSDALNAVIGSFSGTYVSYQNEEGSVLSVTFPEDYQVIGTQNIMQLDQVWYLLTNPVTGFSLVGYVADNTNIFTPVLDDSVIGSDLLGFNINNPVFKIEVKTTNCSTQLYFTDNLNPRRYIDLQELPFKPGTNAVDINLMNVQPLFSIPEIVVNDVVIGGSLVEGDYQFAIQYADIRGNGLTAFYSITNPVRIFLDGKISLNFNELTSKAISISISELDTTGLYDYFNLVAIKTINESTSVDLVGTYFIQNNTYDHTYTGLEESGTNQPLTLTDILRQFDYYDTAGDLLQVDNTLVWLDLQREDDIAFQKIFNQVTVNWATTQIPTGQQKGYHDGAVCANYEGYFRDEVYALEGCFLLDNGKQTTRCHIPGRAPTAYDLQLVSTNTDVVSLQDNICPSPTLQRWQVYNTGSVIGGLTGTANECTGAIPFEYGNMSYWQSTEIYPSNTAIWGDLANTPIRHHKFPDSVVTHIYDNSTVPTGSDLYNQVNHNIYPIGFLVDIQSLYNAIQQSTDLTDAQKRQIVGFKIMRSTRGADKSIVAKGMLFNCGAYEKNGSNYFYPNYPFNDVRPDPFISQTFVEDKSGPQAPQVWLNDFQQNRFTFHSPDTHFYQPSGIAESFLKLETAEYGNSKGHFVQVLNNAKEKLLTQEDLEIALAAGIAGLIGVNLTIDVDNFAIPAIGSTFIPSNFFPSYEAALDIVTKLIPYTNYGWQYNAIGYYRNYVPIPNDIGNKIRYVNYGGYINSGLQGTFGDLYPINNTQRESSVYLSTYNGTDNTGFPYPNQQGLNIPQDTSRTTASAVQLSQGVNALGSSVPFFESISSYYASIKRDLPDQYGEIFSYRAIDTGTQSKFFDDNNNQITSLPVIYGGDCFINQFALKIKHPFFLKSTVNRPDGFDIDYNQDSGSNTNTGNVGYPIYYYSTSNHIIDPSENSDLNGAVQNFITQFPKWYNIFLGGGPTIAAMFELMIALVKDTLLTSIGLKLTNLENYNGDGLYETGQAYLYSYGVADFFVESEVNVDMRQAYNENEGNFYPNVASDIPDTWLQETNTPIAFDNTYTYNKTYSKENKETAFTLLRPDWEPDQVCYINFNNRAIWSDKSDLEETKNNWLVYRPANFFDFPKSWGNLIAGDAMESRQVLIRYENHCQVYNAMATIDTTAISAALGTGALFSGTQPIDFPITDTGYAGTQNKFLLSTENGHIFTDAKRGKIILLRGTQPEELTSAKYLNSIWFQKNLPFNILKAFPTVNIDNNFDGIGLHGVYDNLYKRLIITKLDYQPVNSSVQYSPEYGFYTQAAPTCPPGYTLSADGTRCTRTEIVPATASGTTYNCAPSTYELYGTSGTNIYNSLPANGLGLRTVVTTPFWIFTTPPPSCPTWGTGGYAGECDAGPVNRIMIWNDDGLTNYPNTNNRLPLNTWVGFSTCITISNTQTYYVALSADNAFRLLLDGVLLVDFEGNSTSFPSQPYPFFASATQLHIYPLTINAGTHNISVQGLNYGQAAGFGAEIYANTAGEIDAATSYADLNVIFTTRGQSEFSDITYSCPQGYTLSSTTPCDIPDCSIAQTIPASPIIPCPLTDPNCFCNKSWTFSFSFLVNGWASPHSYIPNFYVEHEDFFQAGTNNIDNGTTAVLYDHNTIFNLFNNFFGTDYPYILETPYTYQYQDQLLQFVEEYATAYVYTDFNIFTQPDDIIYFTQVIAYNNQASTGLLNLIPKQLDNRAQYISYPKYNTNSIDILLTKTDNLYNYNMLWNNQVNANVPQWVETCTPKRGFKLLNSSNFDYSNKSFKKYPLRAKNLKIRSIMNRVKNPYKLVSRFSITHSQNMYS